MDGSEDQKVGDDPLEKKNPAQLASYMDLFLRLLDSVFLLDKESYQVLEANDACERLLNIRTEEIVGKVFSDFIALEDRDEAMKKIRIARRKYYPLEFEARVFSANGKSIFLRLNACSLKLVDETEILQVIAKDVTQEKLAKESLDAYMLELRKLNEKLELLSITDELTKLNNVRHFRNKLREEHERCERYNGKYSVILFDVDNFKHYNDTNGHPAGDQLLRILGKLILDHCRNTDSAARYGGEEFVILCPEVNWEGAMVNAERYRKLIEAHPFDFAEKQPLGKVSVSVGVASFPEVGPAAEDIVKASDQALYYSKKHGRNRSTSYIEMKKLENKVD